MAAAYGVRAGFKKIGAARGHGLRGWPVCLLSPRLLLAGLLLGMTLSAPASAAPVRLLVLGDSLSAGYGLPHRKGFETQLVAALTVRGHAVTVVDGAVSGDTSAGGRNRLDWVLAGGVDAAIVELGANDGLRGLDPKELAANLTAILDTLAARHIPVLFAGMYAPPNLGPAYQREYRAVFDRLGKRPGLIYDPFFLQGVIGVPDLLQPDGLHPNAAGVRKIVQRILPLVERLLAEVHKR
ncbi:MAG TPA: arylesterase [Acetobacteraceae bacterium]|nr:arylesterase [Acetobacteraceae bacterium]